MRITLVRHGHPLHPGPHWAAPRGMRRWIEDYNRAEVEACPLPDGLQRLADEAGAVVCSPQLRCLQSHRLLLGERPPASDPIFAEAHLPYPEWRWPKLPVIVWRVLFRAAWYLGFSRHTESIQRSRERAAEAAERLIELAATHGSVLLVGHGLMNILIADALRARGWRGPHVRLLPPYWHASVYQKRASPEAD